jgi:putative ABC transport system permease protein
MKIEEIKYSLKNLFNRKTRSFLTILSIMIGITAIFTLISFGAGIRYYMDVLAEEAGADKLFIQGKGFAAPGLDENFYITQDEVDFIQKIKGVNEIAGMYARVGKVEYKDQTKYVYLMGYDTDDFEFVFEGFTAEIEKGRDLKKSDLSKVLVGYSYQFEDKVFKRDLELGDTIEVNDVPLEIVGFVSEIGNAQDDSNLYLTLDAFEILYPGIEDKYGFVMLSAEKGVDPEELADKVEEKLIKYKGIEEGEENFQVESFADLLETFGTFINIINGILILIALVSVIVASVNIMNTMYTSVLERTKEIGIMKAIGARNENILFIFVFEAGVLGLIGGIIGEIFGYAISSFGGYIAAVSGYSALQPYFSPYLIIGCLVFSVLVGALSGLLPALQASKLKPVDALRYE